MPAGLDHDHQRAGTQPRAGRRLPPVPLLLPDHRAAGLLVVLDRVVDDQQVCALAGDRPADAGRRHPAVAPFEVPAIDGLRALRDLDAEHRAVLLEEIAGLASPAAGEVRLVAGEDHPPIRKRPQIPGRQILATEFALAVLRRHRDDHAVEPPGGRLVDRLSQHSVQVGQMAGAAPLPLARRRRERRRGEQRQMLLHFPQLALGRVAQ